MTKSKAETLAEQLGEIDEFTTLAEFRIDEAAAHLRAQDALIGELVEALKELADCGAEAWSENRYCVKAAREALAKAEAAR